jgi:cholesterol oxidase
VLDHLLKRRQFIKTAILASGSLIAPIAHHNFAKANDNNIKAVIIGSGFGGAVAALRLGQAGIRTIVLERGRRWPVTSDQNTFTSFRNPDGRSTWLTSKTVIFDEVPIDVYTGVLDRQDEDGISVLCGAGVGGGSLVYNGVTYQPSRELFYRSFPTSIDYDELDRVYYPRVRSMLKASPIPQDILATSYYRSTRVFQEQATVAGLSNRLVDMAIDWEIVRQEINGTKIPSAIIGEYLYGINSGAKNSLDRNYLAQAEQTGFVEILPLHVATAITEVPGQGYRVACNQINEQGEIVASKLIDCSHLFLAAGSMGTTKLLVKAKATGALPKLNNYVGQGWANNGDSLATRSGLPPTNPGQGGPASGLIEHFDNPLGPISLINFPLWNAPEGILLSLAMGIPKDTGSFNYDAATDSVKLTWPADSVGNKQLLKNIEFTYKRLDQRNTTFLKKPQTEVTLGSHSRRNKITSQVSTTITAHPLGGALLGKVCDLYGRVFGYQGLYVVDGALIPGSTGCANPSLTIAAIAERCMDRIIVDI